MPEFPPPIRLPGEPPLAREPYEGDHRHEPPAVVDEAVDLVGAGSSTTSRARWPAA
jgi:hypothetical protein